MANNDNARYVTADGKEHSVDSDWWEETVYDYERKGVPVELVEMAKPLLDGNATQQGAAHRFLMEQANTYQPDPEAMGRMMRMVVNQGLNPGAAKRTTEDDLLKSWDDMMGPAQDRRGADYSLGTSKEAASNAVAQGGYPSGAGARTANPSKKFGTVAHFGD